METKRKKIEALITLLGDEEAQIASTAGAELLSMGREILPQLKNLCPGRSTPVKVRLRQIINWLQTNPAKDKLPPVK